MKCTRWLTASLTILLLAACAEQPVPSKDPTMMNECNESGGYLLNQAIGVSTPRLPDSSKGRDFTPDVGLMGVRAHDQPPTARIMMLTATPTGEPSEIRGLRVGDEATYAGYTIRITSICEQTARFDLVKQPE